MTLLVVSVLVLLALHVVNYFFSLHERDMRSLAESTQTTVAGQVVHAYRRTTPDARWEIIFIHGTPASGAIWGEQFRQPFPAASLLAPDRLGFGRSGDGRRRPNLEEQAALTGALLPPGSGRNVLLVGHSYGGPVALAAALQFTNRVAGVLLIGASLDPAMEKTWLIQRCADWPVIAWALPRPLRQCNRELLTLRDDLVTLRPRLAELGVPVVMLHGGRDRQVPVANVEYLRAELTSAGRSNLLSVMIHDDFTHFIPWEHPEAVTAALIRLTGKIDEPAPAR